MTKRSWSPCVHTRGVCTYALLFPLQWLRPEVIPSSGTIRRWSKIPTPAAHKAGPPNPCCWFTLWINDIGARWAIPLHSDYYGWCPWAVLARMRGDSQYIIIIGYTLNIAYNVINFLTLVVYVFFLLQPCVRSTVYLRTICYKCVRICLVWFDMPPFDKPYNPWYDLRSVCHKITQQSYSLFFFLFLSPFPPVSLSLSLSFSLINIFV